MSREHQSSRRLLHSNQRAQPHPSLSTSRTTKSKVSMTSQCMCQNQHHSLSSPLSHSTFHNHSQHTSTPQQAAQQLDHTNTPQQLNSSTQTTHPSQQLRTQLTASCTESRLNYLSIIRDIYFSNYWPYIHLINVQTSFSGLKVSSYKLKL